MKLHEFQLWTVSNILFVNIDENPLPFEEQFSEPFIQLLESSSNIYDTKVMVTTWHGQFQLETALGMRDANHPRFVHPQSLAQNVKFVLQVGEVDFAESCEPLLDKTSSVLRKEMHRFSIGGANAPIANLQHFGWHQLVDALG